MIIRELQVINFRNLENVRTEFSPGLNLIFGANAQGKTNLLEAIYLLVTGRSFRTASEREMIPWVRDSYEATVVRARVEKRTGEERCLLTFNQSEKNIFVNGEPISRLGDLIGRINAVLFTPADLELVRGAPAVRRRFLDIESSQVSRHYLYHLQRYDLALRQRNALLKQHAHRAQLRDELLVWDGQLAQHGSELIHFRRGMLQKLSDKAAKQYAMIASSQELLELVYRPSIAISAEVFDASDAPALVLRALTGSVEEDIRRGSTNLGPHRDDFDFMLSTHNARDYGSQGQQRSCVLALKLAELEYMEEITREPPLLLLDDLMSELDENRRAALLGSLTERVQTFLTATEKEPVLGFVKAESVYRMEHGNLQHGS
ncbi:MAG: DNA replication/repair protein RecF [Candidatus Sumerlaeaceae bacterium]